MFFSLRTWLLVIGTLAVISIAAWWWRRRSATNRGQGGVFRLERLADLVTVIGFPAVLVGGLAAYLQIAPAISGLLLRASSPTVQSKTVFLIGSGTVRQYLKRVFKENSKDTNIPNEEILERTIANANGTVSYALDGSTGTGVKLLSDAWDKALILAMASDKQEPKDLAPYNQKPPGLFEILVGTDPLEVLLIAKDAASLHQAFGDVIAASKDEEVAISSLAHKTLQSIAATPRPFQIFLTETPSATRKVLRCHFVQTKQVDPKWNWPGEPIVRVWEPGKESWTTVVANTPALVFGSEELDLGERDQLARESGSADNRHAGLSWMRLRLSLGGKDAASLKRNLYLYGTLHYSGTPVGELQMDQDVSNVIRVVLSNVKELGSITAVQARSQMEYFHLSGAASGTLKSTIAEPGALYSDPKMQSSENLCDLPK